MYFNQLSIYYFNLQHQSKKIYFLYMELSHSAGAAKFKLIVHTRMPSDFTINKFQQLFFPSHFPCLAFHSFHSLYEVGGPEEEPDDEV